MPFVRFTVKLAMLMGGLEPQILWKYFGVVCNVFISLKSNGPYGQCSFICKGFYIDLHLSVSAAVFSFQKPYILFYMALLLRTIFNKKLIIALFCYVLFYFENIVIVLVTFIVGLNLFF